MCSPVPLLHKVRRTLINRQPARKCTPARFQRDSGGKSVRLRPGRGSCRHLCVLSARAAAGADLHAEGATLCIPKPPNTPHDDWLWRVLAACWQPCFPAGLRPQVLASHAAFWFCCTLCASELCIALCMVRCSPYPTRPFLVKPLPSSCSGPTEMSVKPCDLVLAADF